MTTPTDQELEKVARELAAMILFQEYPDIRAAEALILSALKQVNTKEEKCHVEDVLADVVLECADFIRRHYSRLFVAGDEYFRCQDILRNANLILQLRKSNQLHTVTRISLINRKMEDKAAGIEYPLSATPQNVSTNVREASEDSSDRPAPCPFCGGNEITVRMQPCHLLFECVDCGSEAWCNNLGGKAKDIWNRRVPPPASMPANPPKEGRASAESETIWLKFVNDCERLSKDFSLRNNSGVHRHFLHAIQESCVPNIDTQRLDWPTIRGTWRKRIEEYEKFQTIDRNNRNLYDANRYEGVATATRWCIEDMDKAMASNNPPA